MGFDHALMGRVAGLALVDIVGTVGIALALSVALDRSPLLLVLGALVLGEAVHLALGVRTPVTLFFLAQ